MGSAFAYVKTLVLVAADGQLPARRCDKPGNAGSGSEPAGRRCPP